MATAPRKRRAEEEPRDDEQPRAKEVRPVDDQEPPVRPPPRLPPKGRSWLQFHMGHERQEASLDEDDEPPTHPPVRSLLVNRSYLDAFFDAELFGPAKIWIEGESMMSLEKSFLLVSFAKTPEGIATLLHFAHNATSLGIEWEADPELVNRDLLLQWMRVAAKLRALPALSSIQLTTSGLPYPHADFFVDSLPDCVTQLKTDALRIATLFRKRATPLESVEFGELFVKVGQDGESISGDRYLVDVFRLKSRRIDLSAWMWEETQLRIDGPLARNEHLEELHIYVDIYALDDVDLPRTLLRLSTINDHFKLTCHTDPGAQIGGLRDLGEMEDVESAAKKFVNVMRGAGFQGNDAELRVLLKGSWKRVLPGPLIDLLRWEREGKIPWLGYSKPIFTGSLVHRGVRICFGLG